MQSTHHKLLISSSKQFRKTLSLGHFSLHSSVPNSCSRANSARRSARIALCHLSRPIVQLYNDDVAGVVSIVALSCHVSHLRNATTTPSLKVTQNRPTAASLTYVVIQSIFNADTTDRSVIFLAGKLNLILPPCPEDTREQCGSLHRIAGHGHRPVYRAFQVSTVELLQRARKSRVF